MYYLVSCVLLPQLCITPSVLYYSVSCALLGQLPLLSQLCVNWSVVYYSLSSVLLPQLCITRSVAIPQSVVRYLVSCVLLRQRSWVRFPFKPEFFQVSSFQLLKLKHLHCDDLHIILESQVMASLEKPISEHTR